MDDTCLRCWAGVQLVEVKPSPPVCISCRKSTAVCPYRCKNELTDVFAYRETVLQWQCILKSVNKSLELCICALLVEEKRCQMTGVFLIGVDVCLLVAGDGSCECLTNKNGVGGGGKKEVNRSRSR